MLSRLFPKQFDNDYKGYTLAIWLLAPVALVTLTQSVTSIVMTRQVLVTADRIPLDRFGANEAETVVVLFSIAAVYRMLVPLLCLLAVIRYRAMIPLTYLLLSIAFIGNRFLLLLHPIERTDGPPTGLAVTLTFFALTLIGFALSISTPASKREIAEE